MKFRRLSIAVVVAWLVAGSFASAADRPATELPDGMVWFNAAEPVKISSTNDHFTLLHFGLYSTPNADVVISDLKALASKYPNQLLVVGIHAAKFFNASGFDDIRQSVQTQDVRYPVAVDDHLAAWREFHVDSLPTVILIAPDGKVLLRKPGGDVFRFVDRTLDKRLGNARDRIGSKSAVAQPPSPLPPPSPVASERPAPVSQPMVQTPESVPTGVDHSPATATLAKPSAALQDAPQLSAIDPSGFVGERVKIGREYSRDIGKITLAIGLSDQTPLNPAVKSYVKVLTKEGEMIGGLETPQPNVEIPIDRRINSDGLLVELSYYYLRRGMTYFKGVLFEVPLVDYSKPENILIRYHLTSD